MKLREYNGFLLLSKEIFKVPRSIFCRTGNVFSEKKLKTLCSTFDKKIADEFEGLPSNILRQIDGKYIAKINKNLYTRYEDVTARAKEDYESLFVQGYLLSLPERGLLSRNDLRNKQEGDLLIEVDLNRNANNFGVGFADITLYGMLDKFEWDFNIARIVLQGF